MKHYFLLLSLFLHTGFLACKNNNTETASSPRDTPVKPADATAFNVDAARSQLAWEASKPTGAHHGFVPVKEGTLFIKNGQFVGGQVVLDMTNLSVADLDGEDKESLESHLKGTRPGKENDFFNVNKFPTATFTVKGSSPIENDPEATHMIQGELTMKGITQPVSFRAKADFSAGHAVKVVTPDFDIDRTRWDVRFMSQKFFDNLKENFVNDEVKISIVLGAIQES